MYQYNNITLSQAQTLASDMTPDKNKTSSLMFGIQWDLVCRFLQEKTELTVDDIKSDTQTKETINGREGLLERDPDNGLYHFSFFDGDALCTVSVEDENLIEQIIVSKK